VPEREREEAEEKRPLLILYEEVEVESFSKGAFLGSHESSGGSGGRGGGGGGA